MSARPHFWLSGAALAVTLFGCATQPGIFVSGNDQLALNCDGGALLDAPCKLEVRGDSAVPVRFSSTQPTRYAHLLREAREKALNSRPVEFALEASDIALLRGLPLEKCHPAEQIGTDTGRGQGDLLQLCLPADYSSTVFLFVRGLCDHCKFEPIALRKRAESRSGSAKK